MNEYLEGIKAIDIKFSLIFSIIAIICFAIWVIFTFEYIKLLRDEFYHHSKVLKITILYGVVTTITMALPGFSIINEDNYINKVNIVKKNIVIENENNKLSDISGVIVDKHYVKVSYLKDTLCIKDAKESKIVVEEVRYSIKPSWIYDKKTIEEINNTKKYFLKEVYQK